MIDGATVLVTGGTGSFGKAFVKRALPLAKRVIVFSRDELKQHEMRRAFDAPNLDFFIGDVRSPNRLRRAFEAGVDVVVHAAALKQVPACEYNPQEAKETNIDGAQNVVNAAIDAGVRKVVALSTDKAVAPCNTYGATKLMAERLFVQGNHLAGGRKTRFSVVRYGNVVGSRGSVIPLWKATTGPLPVTDVRMTRFWLTLEQAVDLVFLAAREMFGGEIFVPKIPSMLLIDLAEAIAPGRETQEVGIRPGEKLHECLLSEDEARHTCDMGGHYIVCPEHQFWSPLWERGLDAPKVKAPEGWRYSSDTNERWLTVEELREMIK